MCHLHGHRHTVWELFRPLPQGSRVACMVGPKLCLYFYSSSLKNIVPKRARSPKPQAEMMVLITVGVF